jgi:hypothetical protein
VCGSSAEGLPEEVAVVCGSSAEGLPEEVGARAFPDEGELEPRGDNVASSTGGCRN